MNWYEIKNIDEIDTPALVLYPQRIAENIRVAKSMVNDDTTRLRPHVKTNKCRETMQMMVDAGIEKFKCATIAEAETLASINAKDVLLAYQPSLPRLQRLINLIKAYPATTFSCLVDNKVSAGQIANACADENIELKIFIDLDVGMHRTGIDPLQALELYAYCAALPSLHTAGLHAYDGHLRQMDIEERTAACNAAFEHVEQLKEQIVAQRLPVPVIIAGGSPTFPIHATRTAVECSPGTFIYWDRGYSHQCAEQAFLPAAVLVTRVISIRGRNNLTLDLGHKSVAAENDIMRRAFFLNAGLVPLSQSEEHLVVDAHEQHGLGIGDVLYAMPFHVCPTVALYERAYVAEENVITGEWKNVARDRKINY